MKNFVRRATLLCVPMLLAACASVPQTQTVANIVSTHPQLTTLKKLVADAGLNDALQATGPRTLFAPDDAAFNALPAATLASLAKDKTRLQTLLTLHVVPGQIKSAEAKSGPVKTAQGASVGLYRSGAFVTVDDAVVTTADLPASNGTVHIIDKVLSPR